MGLAILAAGGQASDGENAAAPPAAEKAPEKSPEPAPEKAAEESPAPARAPGSNGVTDPTNAYRGGGAALVPGAAKPQEPVIDGRNIPKVIEFSKPEPEPASKKGKTTRRVAPGKPKPTKRSAKSEPTEKRQPAAAQPKGFSVSE
jgi:hypothetical protein